MAWFKKHEGEWCVVSSEPIEAGATVEVEKRSGKTTTVVIDEIKVTAPGYYLASIVSDRPTLTTRERKEAKAERLREWADKHDAKADAAGERAMEKAHMIPFGQPILVGHHSEKRDRNFRAGIEAGFRKAHEEAEVAKDQRQRADGIEAQLDRAIYDDDPDAIERIRERIEIMEAKRERIKAYNKSVRLKLPDDSGLTDSERRDLVVNADMYRYEVGTRPFPAYVLANLGQNITRYRKRLSRLEARQ